MCQPNGKFWEITAKSCKLFFIKTHKFWSNYTIFIPVALEKDWQSRSKHSFSAISNVMSAAMRFNCTASKFLVAYISDAE